MASGGFLAAELALNKLLKLVTSGDDAKRAIIEALVAGQILARGRPLIWPKPKPSRISRGKPMVLRDISAPGKPPKLGELEDIPQTFFKKLLEDDVESWDWEEGRFYNSNAKANRQYSEIVFREKDCNELVKKHKLFLDAASGKPPEAKKERLRDASWNDWVAAVAILSQEKQITQGMTQDSLLDRVEYRLRTWGIKPKKTSTVGPTARAILERFATNPPVPPVEIVTRGTPKP